MKTHMNQNFGEAVCISIIYHIPDSWLNLLNGYDFKFWLCNSANQEFEYFS